MSIDCQQEEAYMQHASEVMNEFPAREAYHGSSIHLFCFAVFVIFLNLAGLIVTEWGQL